MLLEKFVNRVHFDSYEDFKNNFRITVPERFNFGFDVVDAIAAASPDKRALVWCDDKGAEAVFTFAQMKEHSDRAANFLRSLGIKKGDRVMLMLKRRYEFWFACVALHKLGAVCIPATHLLTKKDIVYRVTAADIKMIIAASDQTVVDNINAAAPDAPALKHRAAVGAVPAGWHDFSAGMAQASPRFVPPSGAEQACNADPFLLYFTSGTTGMPKMVWHDFTYPLGHIITAQYWQNLQPGGLHLTVADTGWAKAAWGKIYGQWLSENAIFVYDYDKFVPRELLDVVTRHGVTTFCAPPTIFRYLIKEDLSRYDFSKLKWCIVAGEPLNPEVYSQFLKQTGLRLMEGFGQTETVVIIATFPWMEPRPGSMGKPSPCYDIDVVDDNGRSCEAGEEGQIVIRLAQGKPVGMFNGYFGDDQLMKKVLRGGLYYTGDVAYRDEDGYFWFVGRADDVFKSSGYRISPFEVESALVEHPAVLECAVTAAPDADRGLVIKATIVLTKKYQPSAALVKDIQEHVKKVTAPYKYPRIVEFVQELPKTISGKIRRVEIRGKDAL